MRKSFELLTLLVFALVALITIAPSTVFAQTSGEELPPGVSPDDVYRVSRKMYCDVCQGVPISDCPSPTCREWREEVARLLGEGKSDDEILAYFAENYGDKVSGVPLQEGSRNIALALPAAAFVIISLVIAWQLLNMRQRSESRAMQAAKSAGVLMASGRPVPDNVNPDYLERFLKIIEDKS